MRRIKFRVWDDRAKLFAESAHMMNVHTGEIAEVPDRFILEQYIGIYDKNKKEIYEGDIVKVDGEVVLQYNGEEPFTTKEGPYVGTIMYNESNVGACVKREAGGFEIHFIIPNITEIIGNVHENPELLNG